MDPYKVLGIERNSNSDQIKTAYRKLAGIHHPDRGGDTKKFQEIQAAYELLTNPEKMQQFQNPGFNSGFDHGFFRAGGAGNFNMFEDIINQFMHQTRQKIYTVTVFVTLEQIAAGSIENIQINTPNGSKLIKITIPQNIDDGAQVRYDGIMQDGFLQVLFRVHQHPKFTRSGQDLYCKEKVSVFELIIGTTIITTDIFGNKLQVIVPPLTKPDAKFRINGKGLGNSGHQYILIEPIIPDKISDDAINQIKKEVERTKK